MLHIWGDTKASLKAQMECMAYGEKDASENWKYPAKLIAREDKNV